MVEQKSGRCGAIESKIAPRDLASYIDHTLLKPEATCEDIKQVCNEAKSCRFASVCVNPSYIKLVADELKGSNVTPCCVIGFPFGTHTPEVKAAETSQAVAEGAREVDMVVNIGAVKSGDWSLVTRDTKAVVSAAGSDVGVKVILEVCLLTDDEKKRLCIISKEAGAAFVKTSTGYSTGGATLHDVELMRRTVGDEMGVKASGGIKTYEDAIAMIHAGANRLEASGGVQIIGR